VGWAERASGNGRRLSAWCLGVLTNVATPNLAGAWFIVAIMYLLYTGRFYALVAPCDLAEMLAMLIVIGPFHPFHFVFEVFECTTTLGLDVINVAAFFETNRPCQRSFGVTRTTRFRLYCSGAAIPKAFYQDGCLRCPSPVPRRAREVDTCGGESSRTVNIIMKRRTRSCSTRTPRRPLNSRAKYERVTNHNKANSIPTIYHYQWRPADSAESSPCSYPAAQSCRPYSRQGQTPSHSAAASWTRYSHSSASPTKPRSPCDPQP